MNLVNKGLWIFGLQLLRKYGGLCMLRSRKHNYLGSFGREQRDAFNTLCFLTVHGDTWILTCCRRCAVIDGNHLMMKAFNCDIQACFHPAHATSLMCLLNERTECSAHVWSWPSARSPRSRLLYQEFSSPIKVSTSRTPSNYIAWSKDIP